MNILYLNTWDNSGGAAIACRRLLNVFNKNNHKAQLLSLTKKSNSELVFPLSSINQKRGTINLYLEKLLFYFQEKNKSSRFSFSSANFGTEISDNELIKKADILHLHWINFGFLSYSNLEYLFSLNKPIFITLHDMWYFTGGCHHSADCENYMDSCGNCTLYLKNPNETDVSRIQFSKKLALFGNQNITIISCSNWIQNRAKKSTILGKYPNFSIPNPIDCELFKPLENKSLKEKYNIPNDRKIILAVAAKLEVYWKGFEYLINTVNQLDDSFCIVIVGQIEAESLERIITKTISVGSISDEKQMAELYNVADVFLTTSLFENLPNTIMEALACGIPCVGFNTGGIPEMILHKQNGYLAEYKNNDDLISGINWVIENSASKIEARKFAIENYDQEIIYKKINKLYLEKMV